MKTDPVLWFLLFLGAAAVVVMIDAISDLRQRYRVAHDAGLVKGCRQCDAIKARMKK